MRGELSCRERLRFSPAIVEAEHERVPRRALVSEKSRKEACARWKCRRMAMACVGARSG